MIIKRGSNMEDIVVREAVVDDAEDMITYLNIVGDNMK